MKEIGIDLSKQKPKMLTSEIISDSILSVNMGCMDKIECPAVFMKDSVTGISKTPKESPLRKCAR